MIRRNALVGGYDAPRHDRDSGSQRIRHHIEFLQEAGWTVTYLGTNGRGTPRYVRELEQSGVAVYAWGDERFDRLVEVSHFDVALLSFWPVAELCLPLLRRLSPSTRVIVDSVDLHFLRNLRRYFNDFDLGASHASHHRLDVDYGADVAAELNVYAAADAVLTVSEKEASLVADLLGPGHAHPVPDTEETPDFAATLAEREGALFVGSYRHDPNVDAAGYLLAEVWPRVADAAPNHVLRVVGDGMHKVTPGYSLASNPVIPVGWVPDLTPYFSRSRVTLVPLRYGAGTKRKLLQALLAGTPTVATRVGVEGLGLADGNGVLIADGPEAFAEATVRLLTDDDLWAQVARRGRARVAAAHTRQVARDRLLGIVDEVLNRPPRPALLPDTNVERYQQRLLSQERRRIQSGLRDLVRREVPRGSRVLIVSKGDPSLVDLPGWSCSHFPSNDGGEYAGHHPADGETAVELLRKQADAGYLVLPDWTRWWLDHYDQLRRYLESSSELVADRPGVGMVFALRPTPPKSARITADTIRIGPRLPAEDPAARDQQDVRLIAFFLPQFHPIPENDRWWGPGFTEWTNVTRAGPLFPGHYQPHLPADLGFYDLRLRETRAAQADLARRYGISAFCWYHYWFHGTRLLSEPFDDVLESGQPDFPFALCWANEPWSRRWDGGENDVLQPQAYSVDDDRNHIRALLPALADSRAFTVEDRPLFAVYRADQLPEPSRTVEVWREEVARAGLPGVHLVAVETGWDAGWDATEVGFDAKVLFQPQFSLLRKVPRRDIGAEQPEVYDYESAWPRLADAPEVAYRRYGTVFPMWDNTPRRGAAGLVVHGSTPEHYQAWLQVAIERAARESPQHRIVFLNAWNEWSEGCHLEPDSRHGTGYLEATLNAVNANRSG